MTTLEGIRRSARVAFASSNRAGNWHAACSEISMMVSRGVMMTKDAWLARAGLGMVVVTLLACFSRYEPQPRAPFGSAAWYEQQVEEGFGRLDQLPRN